mmetsp:Transcript_11808/g.34669  ORF Transcript_11808/g.34669 Transcript_11808/m.34669 type:complete len:385 (+) Transcript_11808:547-1701(+)
MQARSSSPSEAMGLLRRCPSPLFEGYAVVHGRLDGRVAHGRCEGGGARVRRVTSALPLLVLGGVVHDQFGVSILGVGGAADQAHPADLLGVPGPRVRRVLDNGPPYDVGVDHVGVRLVARSPFPTSDVIHGSPPSHRPNHSLQGGARVVEMGLDHVHGRSLKALVPLHGKREIVRGGVEHYWPTAVHVLEMSRQRRMNLPPFLLIQGLAGGVHGLPSPLEVSPLIRCLRRLMMMLIVCCLGRQFFLRNAVAWLFVLDARRGLSHLRGLCLATLGGCEAPTHTTAEFWRCFALLLEVIPRDEDTSSSIRGGGCTVLLLMLLMHGLVDGDPSLPQTLFKYVQGGPTGLAVVIRHRVFHCLLHHVLQAQGPVAPLPADANIIDGHPP